MFCARGRATRWRVRASSTALTPPQDRFGSRRHLLFLIQGLLAAEVGGAVLRRGRLALLRRRRPRSGPRTGHARADNVAVSACATGAHSIAVGAAGYKMAAARQLSRSGRASDRASVAAGYDALGALSPSHEVRPFVCGATASNSRGHGVSHTRRRAGCARTRRDDPCILSGQA
jgi:hypothetical protein